MRKDVKLGFAIGGVLLAVLIVYVLVVPGGKDKRLTSATGGSDATAQKANGGGAGVKLEPVVPPPTTQPLPGANTASATGTPPPAPPATFNPPESGGGTDPFEQQPVDPPVSANAKSKDVDWSKLLNATGNDVLMVTPGSAKKTEIAAVLPVSTEKKTADAIADITKPGPTPVVPPSALDEKPTADPAPTSGTPVPAPVTPADPVVPPTTPPVADKPAEPAIGPQQPPVTSAAAQTHTVETGETFSTIALKYYGDANLYSPLMRANPSIEPTKLRPGMKVSIPPASEVRPTIAKAPPVHGSPVNTDHAQVSSSKVEIDPATQYRVQAGDSLYSIGKKLYGRGDKADALYQANKAMIGDDMHRLKLGQVLSLPEPPTKK